MNYMKRLADVKAQAQLEQASQADTIIELEQQLTAATKERDETLEVLEVLQSEEAPELAALQEANVMMASEIASLQEANVVLNESNEELASENGALQEANVVLNESIEEMKVGANGSAEKFQNAQSQLERAKVEKAGFLIVLVFAFLPPGIGAVFLILLDGGLIVSLLALAFFTVFSTLLGA